ncbi:tetratricopeptide repeat protein [bacterium]|nr:tetratricopeptide repeat protein [bacterium]
MPVGNSDSGVVFYNPAGIAALKRPEICMMGFKPYVGLENLNWNYYMFSSAMPAGPLMLSAAYGGFTTGGMYKEDTAILALAGPVIPRGSLGNLKISGGLSLKYLKHSYEFPAALALEYKENSAAAITADAGFIFEIPGRFGAGLYARNIVPADVGLKTEDKVPLEFGANTEYQTGKIGAFDSITVGVNVTFRNQSWEDKLSGGAGLELAFLEKSLFFRMGYQQDEVSAGFGSIIGIGNAKLVVDYAVAVPLGFEQTASSHRLQTVFKFGNIARDTPVKKVKRKKEPKVIKNLSPAQKKALMSGHFNKATSLFNQGNYRQAIDEWKKVLEIDPDHKLSKIKIEKALLAIQEEQN